MRRDLNAYAPNTGMGAFTITGQFTQNPQTAARTGSALADLLLGLDSTAKLSIWQEFGVRRWENPLFINDDFRVTQRLTLNLGLRYDLTLPWTEAHNRIAKISAPSLGRCVSGGFYAGPRLDHARRPTTGTFAPRFGLAYELTPKTVVRAAYGIFYMFPCRPALQTWVW